MQLITYYCAKLRKCGRALIIFIVVRLLLSANQATVRRGARPLAQSYACAADCAASVPFPFVDFVIIFSITLFFLVLLVLLV